MKKVILACAALLMLPGPTFAASFVHRDYKQEHRINQGVRSGELTRHEARRLRHQQHRIHRMERRAARDGVITARERREIRRAQNRVGRHIYNKKHNYRSY